VYSKLHRKAWLSRSDQNRLKVVTALIGRVFRGEITAINWLAGRFLQAPQL
jgi:hypothetical protein